MIKSIIKELIALADQKKTVGQALRVDDVYTVVDTYEQLTDEETSKVFDELISQGIMLEEEDDEELSDDFIKSVADPSKQSRAPEYNSTGIRAYFSELSKSTIFTAEEEKHYFELYSKARDDEAFEKYEKASKELEKQGREVTHIAIAGLLNITANEALSIDRKMCRAMNLRNFIIEHNLRLVISIAKRYIGRGVDFEDIIQAGNCGLIKATGKFDYTRGTKFSTYSTWWIKLFINKTISENANAFRIPVHVSEAWAKIRKAAAELAQRLDKEATIEDIAAELDWDVRKVLHITRIMQAAVSLDAALSDDSDGTTSLIDTIEDPSASVTKRLEEESIVHSIDRVFEEMAAGGKSQARLAFILQLRYGYKTRYQNLDCLPRTLEQVGLILSIMKNKNICMERARQLEKKAKKVFKKVCTRLKYDYLVDFSFEE